MRTERGTLLGALNDTRTGEVLEKANEHFQMLDSLLTLVD